jgi:hypothetical protein
MHEALLKAKDSAFSSFELELECAVTQAFSALRSAWLGREACNGHKGALLWFFTWLSGLEKSTIAGALE